MNKIKIFFRRLFGGSFRRMFKQIDLIHRETGANRFFMFFDMIWCIFRYGVGYQDYHVFGFALIHGKNRRTFMTMNDNSAVSRRLNSREYFHYFDDKAEFNEQFREYIGRDFIDLRNADAAALERFCGGKRTVFAKRVSDFGGSGVSREELSPETDFAALYERLCDNKQYLVEDELAQHEKMNLLSPSSINTIRVVTLFWNGEAHFMYALVRMSNGENCVDNICSGGMYVSIGADGVIRKPAFCDATGEYYAVHPFTKTEFSGFEIPMFGEAVELCKRAAAVFPQVGYIGWDVAVTPEKPVLVEGNTLPSYDMCQNYGHIDDKLGVLPRFKAVLGDDFFKKNR
ncbi:MAG: hypothetical protein NC299_11045 [Lachnospiraceae bacterium]|nr:hypothetical protein [Ruminococcus sp.]MCM1275883.1 hypothetical protein [Lachnospiraceae bacterium]